MFVKVALWDNPFLLCRFLIGQFAAVWKDLHELRVEDRKNTLLNFTISILYKICRMLKEQSSFNTS